MKNNDFVVMLKLNPLFGDLPKSLIDAMAQLCTLRTLAAGATLFQRGDPGDALYGVRRGQLVVETGTSDGQRNTLAFLGPGDLFGEIAVLDGEGRTADVVAVQETQLFALRRADVLALIAREPDVAIKLIEMLCQRLRSMSSQIDQGLTMKLEGRLAARLLLLAEDFGHEIDITQEQLARSVGATRESVNRLLSQWEESGVVETRRGSLTLKNVGALQAARVQNSHGPGRKR